MGTGLDPGDATGSSRASRRRGPAVVLVLLLAVGAVVAIVLGTRSASPPAAADVASAIGATTVQRRDLVATDTESGTLSYANPQTVYDRLSGTMTWLPTVGQEIRPGQALFQVDGKPVILMDGSTPAYRALKSSDSGGQDVLELNRNLVSLGFNPDGIVIDDLWQSATTAGVDALQASLGEAETGSLSLGKVVFLPGNQLVSAVNGTLGAMVSDRAVRSSPEFVDLTKKPGKESKPRKKGPKGKRGKSTQSLQALVTLLQAEIEELRAQGGAGGGGHGGSNDGSGSSGKSGSSGRSGKSGSSGGSGSSGAAGGSGGATAVLLTTSTQLVVTVDLDASKQSEAKVGETVTVELPAGITVAGRITAVSPVAQSSSGSGGAGGGAGSASGGGGSGGGGGNGSSGSSGATIPVTITLSGHQSGAGLDQAAVSVSFQQQEASNVLSVPVTALLATAGGGYAVQEALPPHTLVAVTTGLFAAGYVQISGPGIYSGLQVTDSQG